MCSWVYFADMKYTSQAWYHMSNSGPGKTETGDLVSASKVECNKGRLLPTHAQKLKRMFLVWEWMHGVCVWDVLSGNYLETADPKVEKRTNSPLW